CNRCVRYVSGTLMKGRRASHEAPKELREARSRVVGLSRLRHARPVSGTARTFHRRMCSPRLVRDYPVARVALCRCDLDIRHLLGDLAAHDNGVSAALQRRKIEPFMRGNEIDDAGTAARPIKPALKQHVGERGGFHRRRHIQIERSLKHFASPLFVIGHPPPRAAPVQLSNALTPFAGLQAIMPIKFEGWFKVRDKGDVNARPPRAVRVSETLVRSELCRGATVDLPSADGKPLTIATAKARANSRKRPNQRDKYLRKDSRSARSSKSL